MTLEVVGGPNLELDRGGVMALGHLYIRGDHPEVALVPTPEGPKSIGVPVSQISPFTGQKETDWQVYGKRPDVEKLYSNFVDAIQVRNGV